MYSRIRSEYTLTKTFTNVSAFEIASASKVKVAITPIRMRVRPAGRFSYAWLKNPPRSSMRARSSAETSTLRGVRRKTLSATRCMPPSSAYVRPLAKSMSRFASSWSAPWRLRMTGMPSLKRSAICCASLKLRGRTRWTRTAPGPGTLSTPRRRRGSGAGRRTLVRAFAADSGSVQSSNSSRRPRRCGRRRTFGRSAYARWSSSSVTYPSSSQSSSSAMPKYTRVRFQTSAKAMVERMLPLQEDCAHPDEGRSLLHGDGVVLARPHRQLRQALRLGQLAQAAEIPTRRLGVARRRRHGHEPAHVPIVLQEGRQILRLDAGLRRLAGEVHLDERGDGKPLRRRLGVERVAQLARRIDDLRLAALQVADEVPPERVPVARVLRLEILRAVLANDRDAGIAEQLHVVERDVLRRGDDRHARADLFGDALVSRADRRRLT